MAKIISCPSCARRLSVNQAPAAEKLFKCPACQAVFALPADDKANERAEVDELPRGAPSAGGLGHGGFSESRLQPTRPRNDADDEPPVGLSVSDDAADDWPDYDRPVKKTKSRRGLILALSGLALLVVVVGAVLYLDIGPEPELVGSWGGTFRFAGMKVDCKYQFRQDGTFVEEHMEKGVMNSFPGRYKYANGRVTIRWDRGGFEMASVRRTGLNTIEYVILAHSDDPRQIGCKVTFSRLAR
jgi:hypothetical protein